MAKVGAFLKLYTTVALLHCAAVVSSQKSAQKSSQQMLNQTSAHLTSTRIKALEEHNNWQIIDLSHNSIEFIDAPDLLARQTALDALLLDHNVKFRAKGNEKIFTHKRLRRMSCRACGFSEIQAQNFAGFESLVELVLADNRIKRIDGAAFRENHYLTRLDLSGNLLQVVPVETFANRRMFEELSLSANPLELPKMKHFLKSESLKSLAMDKCNLTDLYPQTFAEMRNLTRLRLNYNKIEALPVDIFKPNVNLESLFVEGNQLRVFPAAILDYLQRIDELCADNNPYTDDDDFRSFLAVYKRLGLRTQDCESDAKRMIEFLFADDSDSVVDKAGGNRTVKFEPLKFHEGISDFFIGSYLTVILIVQAIALVVLTIFYVKISKYEKLGSGEINYANTILNDNDIYTVFKLNE